MSDGSTVQLLAPGVPPARVRNDLTAFTPCLFVSA